MELAYNLHHDSMKQGTCKKKLYNIWSNSYDSYVSELEYTGPQELVSLLSSMILNFNEKSIDILDFGCGTGLVGEEIKRQNLNINLDGVDISPLMLAKAKEKDCYQNLFEINLLEKSLFEISQKKYQIIVSCGVFLEGHAPLEILEKLLDNLYIEGFLIFTIRDSYLEKEKDKFNKYILDNPRVRILKKMNIKYLKDVKCQLFMVYYLGAGGG